RSWDADGNLLHTIAGRRAIENVAVSPDGSLAVAISPGYHVARVYELASGNLVASLDHNADVSAAAFSPKGDLLVTGADRDGYVWDTADWSLRHRLVGHEARITDVVFAPDGRVVTTSVDSQGRVWDPSTGDLIFAL